MAYCAWTDVVAVFPEAGDIESDSGNQTSLIAAGTDMTDTLLSPYMRTPIQTESDGAYPEVIIQICALLTADAVAWRRLGAEDEAYAATYGDSEWTLTKYGHRAMMYIQALAKKEAATDDEITGPEMVIPLVVTSFTTTNGTVQARFAGGGYTRNTRGVYKFTITSSGGTVAGEDLTFSVVRDNDETITAELSVISTDWYSIEYGLQVRFVDAASAAAWTQDDTFTATCESFENRPKTTGPRTLQVDLG